MHLRVALAVLVLGRRRRIQDGRVHDGAGADLQPMLLQIPVDQREDALAQTVPFQQVTELAHRGFVWRRLAAQVDGHEVTHRQRVVHRILDARIGQVEPGLEEVNPQHPLHPDRRTALAAVRIVRLDQPHQLAPWNHQFHRSQKLRSTRLLTKPLESTRHRQRLLLHKPPRKHNVI